MSEHEWPNIREDDIAGYCEDVEDDEKDEVEEEENGREDLHGRRLIAIGEIMEEDGDGSGTWATVNLLSINEEETTHP